MSLLSLDVLGSETSDDWFSNYFNMTILMTHNNLFFLLTFRPRRVSVWINWWKSEIIESRDAKFRKKDGMWLVTRHRRVQRTHIHTHIHSLSLIRSHSHISISFETFCLARAIFIAEGHAKLFPGMSQQNITRQFTGHGPWNICSCFFPPLFFYSFCLLRIPFASARSRLRHWWARKSWMASDALRLVPFHL